MTLDEILDVLYDCQTQLEYLDQRFPTGTTPAILVRIENAIFSIEQDIKVKNKTL